MFSKHIKNMSPSHLSYRVIEGGNAGYGRIIMVILLHELPIFMSILVIYFKMTVHVEVMDFVMS